jgi:hypothetical protein
MIQGEISISPLYFYATFYIEDLGKIKEIGFHAWRNRIDESE